VIGRISGILATKQAPVLLVDVQGVGYELQVSLTTYFGLPDVGEPVTLVTHFVVREDAQQLYGFGDEVERQLFRSLIRISGVGPKMALAILSGMTADEFVQCVRNDDVASLVRLPGVGKKTAERLLVEMRGRLDGWATKGGLPVVSASSERPTSRSSVIQEAESALVSLGYKPQEAARMVNAVLPDERDVESEQLIRLALRNMVR